MTALSLSLSLCVRLLNTEAPAADTEINDEEARERQASARLRALLHFHQESEVIETALAASSQASGHRGTGCADLSPLSSSCTAMWCTWWTVCGTAAAPC